MAQGDIVVFNEAKQNIGNGLLDLSASTDWYVMLITTLPTAAQTTPDSSDFTQVTGGTSYVAGGAQLTTTWLQSGAITTFDSTVNPTWVQDVTGPTNIVAGLIYSSTAPGEDALAYIDLTTDGGVTPLSLQAGNITITFAGTGILTI